MYHFFVTQEQIGEKEIRITGSDVNHIRNVLRMTPGVQISVSSRETGVEYRCEISAIEEDCVTAGIMWAQEADTELPVKIYLFQGLPKGDKMEFIIQKAVELGAYEIIPVATKRAVVKLDGKKEASKRKRWNAISESAAKQSKRTIVPEVRQVMSFREAVEYASSCRVKLIPYELAEGMEKTKEVIAGIRPGDMEMRRCPGRTGKMQRMQFFALPRDRRQKAGTAVCSLSADRIWSLICWRTA